MSEKLSAEDKAKSIKEFCEFSDLLQKGEIGEPCPNPSDDEEFKALYRKISESIQKDKARVQRYSRHLDDIYYGHS